MKGIILAGGSGTRLYPLTQVVSKQLLPIYDKPMIYYPLSVLLLAEIREVLIISTPQDIQRFEQLLGNGKDYGINIEYAIQEHPNGLAEAFIIGEKFISDESVCLVLGDNFFYGSGLKKSLLNAVESATKNKATVFGYHVENPSNFGVVEFNEKYEVISIEEKPETPKSNYAVVGLYFYDNRVVEFSKKIKPSKRGELEITDLNAIYLKEKALDVELLGRGFTWLDSGTHESLAEATQFVKMIEEHQGLKISCLEEIAFMNSWISIEQLRLAAKKYSKSNYGKYIESIIDGKVQQLK